MSTDTSISEPSPSAGTTAEPFELFGLMDFLILLARRKMLIVGVTLAVAAIAAVFAMLMPNIYAANARILTPQQGGQSIAAAVLGQVSGLVAGAAGLKSPPDLYIGMLKSRNVADRLIERFTLKTVFNEASPEMLRRRLDGMTKLTSGKDGLINIVIEHSDPQLAAKLANGYVDELTRLTNTLAISEASKRRIFFEKQLEMVKNNLANAEAALKGAINVGGVTSVDAESAAMVEMIARLRGQIAGKEIQLRAMQSFITAQSMEFKRAEQELISMRVELAKFEDGTGSANSTASNGKLASLENIKLLRDVKYHQMLYEVLSKQYELARLDEAKDSSIVQVLDPAIAPERKARPARAVIVVLATLAALFATVGFVLVSEAFRRATKDERKMAQLLALRNALQLHRQR